MHSRTLDRAGRLAGELVVDAIFIVRRKTWHWPVVLLGVVLGFAIGLAVGLAATQLPGLVAIFTALVAGGLGLNIGSDFRFIARSPTRLLLYESSRVIGLPTELVGAVGREQVACAPSGPALHLTIGGEVHVMARHHARRLQRMVATPSAAAPAGPRNDREPSRR